MKIIEFILENNKLISKIKENTLVTGYLAEIVMTEGYNYAIYDG